MCKLGLGYSSSFLASTGSYTLAPKTFLKKKVFFHFYFLQIFCFHQKKKSQGSFKRRTRKRVSSLQTGLIFSFFVFSAAKYLFPTRKVRFISIFKPTHSAISFSATRSSPYKLPHYSML